MAKDANISVRLSKTTRRATTRPFNLRQRVTWDVIRGAGQAVEEMVLPRPRNARPRHPGS